MDIKIINKLIQELEQSEDTSLSNIRNLSALYNVRTNLNKIETQAEKELIDILPSYKGYINTKQKYQLHQITDEAVYIAMEAVCRETKEFIHALYSGTDTPKEREIIQNMIKEIQ